MELKIAKLFWVDKMSLQGLDWVTRGKLSKILNVRVEECEQEKLSKSLSAWLAGGFGFLVEYRKSQTRKMLIEKLFFCAVGVDWGADPKSKTIKESKQHSRGLRNRFSPPPPSTHTRRVQKCAKLFHIFFKNTKLPRETFSLFSTTSESSSGRVEQFLHLWSR